MAWIRSMICLFHFELEFVFFFFFKLVFVWKINSILEFLFGSLIWISKSRLNSSYFVNLFDTSILSGYFFRLTIVENSRFSCNRQIERINFGFIVKRLIIREIFWFWKLFTALMFIFNPDFLKMRLEFWLKTTKKTRVWNSIFSQVVKYHASCMHFKAFLFGYMAYRPYRGVKKITAR